MQELQITSSLDCSRQPVLFYHPDGKTEVPLVVGLHTWSFNRFNQEKHYLPLCKQYGYALLLPEFRGPNLAENPLKEEACGSELTRQDVIDAVKFVCDNYPIDRRNIFLLGCSGGGHMSLLAGETAPELFRAIEIWCPVSDLILWYEYLVEAKLHYVPHLEACLGGSPAQQPDKYAERSPARHTQLLKGMPVSIHHGRYDHIVPYRHSIALAQQLVANGNDRVFLDIFDGGHEQKPAHSFEWFAKLVGSSSAAIGITG